MNQRVRAIINKGEKVLLIHRIKENNDYWVFPGGGIKSTDKDKKGALARECKEELGVNIVVEDLYMTLKFQESLEFFYYCRIESGSLDKGSGPEFRKETRYVGEYKLKWVSLEDFESIDIKPQEVKNRLLDDVC